MEFLFTKTLHKQVFYSFQESSQECVQKRASVPKNDSTKDILLGSFQKIFGAAIISIHICKDASEKEQLTNMGSFKKYVTRKRGQRNEEKVTKREIEGRRCSQKNYITHSKFSCAKFFFNSILLLCISLCSDDITANK